MQFIHQKCIQKEMQIQVHAYPQISTRKPIKSAENETE